MSQVLVEKFTRRSNCDVLIPPTKIPGIHFAEFFSFFVSLCFFSSASSVPPMVKSVITEKLPWKSSSELSCLLQASRRGFRPTRMVSFIVILRGILDYSVEKDYYIFKHLSENSFQPLEPTPPWSLFPSLRCLRVSGGEWAKAREEFSYEFSILLLWLTSGADGERRGA